MAPAPLRVRSFAKLNLGLAVGPARGDGYHALATVYQAVDLTDTIEFRFGGRPGWRVETDSPSVPFGERNLVWRALEALRPFMRRPAGISVFIRKKIPDGAGLGGGSGNAAATLLAVNDVFRLGVSETKMHAMAASLGSDVPFFLAGGAALGIGRGEILCPLPGDVFGKEVFYALAVPETRLSTASVYRAADARKATRRESASDIHAGVLRAVEAKSWRTLSLRNGLEAAAMRLAPEIGALKRALGGKRVAMTGSGSGVFALFGTHGEAKRAARRAARAVPGLRLAHAGKFLARRSFVLP